jgi:hypothetical protein
MLNQYLEHLKKLPVIERKKEVLALLSQLDVETWLAVKNYVEAVENP